MRGHVVPVVPALDALGVLDPLTEPRLAPLVFDQHRGARPEHPVRPRDRRLVPGLLRAGDRVQHQVPALVHAAGEHVAGAERRGGVPFGHGIAEPRGDAPGILGEGDPLLQATVEHVGRRECRQQPGPDALRFLVDRGSVERRRDADLGQRGAQASGARFEGVAEQVAHRDERCDDGRRRQGIAGLEPGGARRLERLARGGVVVRGRGTGPKRLEDAGTDRCVEVARRGAQGRRVELASFGVRREARRRHRPRRARRGMPPRAVPPARNAARGTHRSRHPAGPPRRPP